MRVLRFPAVKTLIGGYSRMHVDRLEKAGRFPRRVQLGPNSVGWLENEVLAWIEARAAARDIATSTEGAG